MYEAELMGMFSSKEEYDHVMEEYEQYEKEARAYYDYREELEERSNNFERQLREQELERKRKDFERLFGEDEWVMDRYCMLIITAWS